MLSMKLSSKDFLFTGEQVTGMPIKYSKPSKSAKNTIFISLSELKTNIIWSTENKLSKSTEHCLKNIIMV